MPIKGILLAVLVAAAVGAILKLPIYSESDEDEWENDFYSEEDEKDEERY